MKTAPNRYIVFLRKNFSNFVRRNSFYFKRNYTYGVFSRIKFNFINIVKFFNKVATYIYAKAEKNRAKIEKYSFWGVTLFVGIPLPMTGAWTGTLVAAIIDMKFWKAVLSAFIGVLIAGVIMSLVSYGVLAIFA
jgi:uncharacterized membrane protein